MKRTDVYEFVSFKQTNSNVVHDWLKEYWIDHILLKNHIWFFHRYHGFLISFFCAEWYTLWMYLFVCYCHSEAHLTHTSILQYTSNSRPSTKSKHHQQLCMKTSCRSSDSLLRVYASYRQHLFPLVNRTSVLGRNNRKTFFYHSYLILFFLYLTWFQIWYLRSILLSRAYSSGLILRKKFINQLRFSVAIFILIRLLIIITVVSNKNNGNRSIAIAFYTPIIVMKFVDFVGTQSVTIVSTLIRQVRYGKGMDAWWGSKKRTSSWPTNRKFGLIDQAIFFKQSNLTRNDNKFSTSSVLLPYLSKYPATQSECFLS